MGTDIDTRYLIIGNSAGAIGAAEAIRELDTAGSLTMVSDEPYPVYSRPLISKYLTGERTLDTMLYRPRAFYEQNGIRSLLGRTVLRLDLESRIVELAGGQRIAWEKLLLAPGGVPIMPPMEGRDKNGVFSFTTLDDARALDEHLARSDKAVVIGGGLIGISVTEALQKRGVKVTVVEMKDRILNTILDETASSLAEERVVEAGVQVITGCTVAEITGRDWVTGVVLDDGRDIRCGVVVVAIGVSPRIGLAADAGIEVNRGILVDDRMATSMADVYACGDAVEAYDFVYEVRRPVPIWPNAYIGGRVAGQNMAGREARYAGGTTMNALNYFGMDIASAGMVVPPEGGEGYETVSRHAGGVYRRVVARKGIIMGMVFVGDIDKSGIVYGLMKDRTDVSGLDEKLVADDFGLAHLPRAVWQERLEAPPVEAGGLAAG